MISLPFFFRARIWGEVLLARYSAWPCVGIALCLATVVFSWAVLVPMRTEVESMRTELARRESQTKQSAQPQSDSSLPESAFLSVLAPAASTNVVFEGLIDLARQHQLHVEQVDYQRSLNQTALFERLGAGMAVRGSYPSFRSWAEEALRTYPYLSLDQVGFERSSEAGQSVHARIKVTLWFRPQPLAKGSEGEMRGGAARE